MELKDVSDGLTDQALILHSHANGQETQVNTEDIFDAEKHEPTANVDIKVQGTELYIDVSGFSVAQLGSDTKALEVQNCKLCSKNCYTSSD